MRQEPLDILAALARLQGQGSYYTPVERVAEELGADEQAVRDSMVELEQHGFVSIAQSLTGTFDVWITRAGYDLLRDAGYSV